MPGIPATKGVVVLVLAAWLAGCASGPSLTDYQKRSIGRSVKVYYVQAPDNIVVDNPASVELKRAGDSAVLIFLFGPAGVAGSTALMANHNGGVDTGIDANAYAFRALHWPDRIQAAVFAGVQSSKLPLAGPIQVLDSDPGYAGYWNYAKGVGADSVMFLVPEIHADTDGDMVIVSIHVFIIPRGADAMSSYIAQQTLDISQDVVAVPGGKTWEEQKEIGHKIHALTTEQYFNFWFEGQPKPMAGFMDAAIPDIQRQLEGYLSGVGAVPGQLPELKMVVN